MKPRNPLGWEKLHCESTGIGVDENLLSVTFRRRCLCNCAALEFINVVGKRIKELVPLPVLTAGACEVRRGRHPEFLPSFAALSKARPNLATGPGRPGHALTMSMKSQP